MAAWQLGSVPGRRDHPGCAAYHHQGALPGWRAPIVLCGIKQRPSPPPRRAIQVGPQAAPGAVAQPQGNLGAGVRAGRCRFGCATAGASCCCGLCLTPACLLRRPCTLQAARLPLVQWAAAGCHVRGWSRAAAPDQQPARSGGGGSCVIRPQPKRGGPQGGWVLQVGL